MSTDNVPAVEFARQSMARSLRKELAEQGWTAAKLAEKSGLPLDTIESMLTGMATPRVSDAKAVSKAMPDTSN